MLAQYVKQGEEELDQEKLPPLLRVRYRALPDAFAELGKPEEVRVSSAFTAAARSRA